MDHQTHIEKAEAALKVAEQDFGPESSQAAACLENYSSILKTAQLRLLEAGSMDARAKVIRENLMESEKTSIGTGTPCYFMCRSCGHVGPAKLDLDYGRAALAAGFLSVITLSLIAFIFLYPLLLLLLLVIVWVWVLVANRNNTQAVCSRCNTTNIIPETSSDGQKSV
ncbi:MAG TPA: hypothetical protein V6C89_16225 [Drouetiella sp.]